MLDHRLLTSVVYALGFDVGEVLKLLKPEDGVMHWRQMPFIMSYAAVDVEAMKSGFSAKGIAAVLELFGSVIRSDATTTQAQLATATEVLKGFKKEPKPKVRDLWR
jgi:hypothetical protein